MATGWSPPLSSSHASWLARCTARSASKNFSRSRRPGREGAVQPAQRGVGHRLVDGLPPEHEVAEGLRHPVDVTGPVVAAGLVVQEAAEVVGEPAREREVVEAHPHRQAGVVRGLEHRAVVLDGVAVPVAGLGLEAGPLDRQPVVGEAGAGQQREVVAVVGGEPVAVQRCRGPPELLPPGPVGAGRGPLGLGGRGGRPPPEVVLAAGVPGHRAIVAGTGRPDPFPTSA